MKMFLLTGFILLSCIFVSCNDSGIIKRKTFSEKVSPLIDSLPVSVTINPLFGKLNADNIILGSPVNRDGVLNVFSLPGMEFLYSAIRKGRAANEFLAVNWAYSLLENIVSLYDVPNARIRSYQVSQDTLFLTREYELKEKIDGSAELTAPYVSMVQLNESQFITRVSTWAFDQLKLQNMESGETESIIPDLFKKDSARDQYLDYNYAFGFGNDFLVRAYRYLDRIEIFRKNGDNTFTPEITVTDSKNHEINLSSEDRVVYYRDIFCGERRIYLLFSGGTQRSSAKSVIEIFDYAGNSVALIPLDRSLSMIMVDEDGRKIYGIDPDNPDYIYIYNFGRAM